MTFINPTRVKLEYPIETLAESFALGLVARFRPTADATGVTTAHQWGQVAFAATAGRAYEVHCGVLVSSTAAGDSVATILRVDADELAGSFATTHLQFAGGTSGYWIERTGIFLPTVTGTRNALSTIARTIGTGTLTASAVQSYISVTDIGIL